MPLFEIINPSDPLTMYAPDLLTAGVAVAVLGKGKLGAQNLENPEESTPILFGWDDWFVDQGVSDLSSWIEDNRLAVADALRSVALGNADSRADYDAALQAIEDPVKRSEFIRARNDRRRSSVSDWEGFAHVYAERLEKFNAEIAGPASAGSGERVVETKETP